MGWDFPFEADDPAAKPTLEVFRRHHIHPQLWVMQSLKPPQGEGLPKTEEEWTTLWKSLSPTAQKQLEASLQRRDLTQSPEEQVRRVRKEAERIYALVKLAAPYGSTVELYNHDGWYGMVENEVAIIARLKELGVGEVGVVYKF